MADKRNIFDRLFRRRESGDGAPEFRPVRVVSPYREGLSFVYDQEPLSVATVYRCVNVLSESVASLTMEYLRMKGDRMQAIADDINYLVQVQPQPELSAHDFWARAVELMLLEGNAYIYPRYVEGVLTDLCLCEKGTVGHDVVNGIYMVSDTYSGVQGRFGEQEMIHLFLHTCDGRNGESVLTHARRTIGIASAGDQETQSRFESAGAVRGLVSNGSVTHGIGTYSPDELNNTAMDIDSRFARGEHIVSIPGQVEFRPVSLSSTDMQFLESRKFTVREICRFFGVHPSYVFDDTSNNYKSAENASAMFLTMTLDPILKRIESEFNRKLVPRSQFGKRCFRFDRMGVYTLDLTGRADYQKKTIESGIYSINDWRRKENQPKVEGGDTVYISTNLAALGSEKLMGGATTEGKE